MGPYLGEAAELLAGARLARRVREWLVYAESGGVIDELHLRWLGAGVDRVRVRARVRDRLRLGGKCLRLSLPVLP